MKTSAHIIFVVLMVSSAITVSGQSEKKNSVNGGFLAVPLGDVSSIVFNAEYERFLNPHNSLVFRVEYLGYTFVDGSETTDGTGGGVGFSYKHYFGGKGYSGFYLAPAMELIFTSWKSTDNSYSQTYYSDGTTFNICPNVAAGYRFNFGDVFSLTPSVTLGYRAGVSIETNGNNTSESSPFGGVGLSFSMRF